MADIKKPSIKTNIAAPAALQNAVTKTGTDWRNRVGPDSGFTVDDIEELLHSDPASYRNFLSWGSEDDRKQAKAIKNFMDLAGLKVGQDYNGTEYERKDGKPLKFKTKTFTESLKSGFNSLKDKVTSGLKGAAERNSNYLKAGTTPNIDNNSSIGSDVNSNNQKAANTDSDVNSDLDTESEEEEDNPPPLIFQKPSYRMKSIIDAYKDGEIDKSTRNYLIVDTIATFARNLSKDIANIGAAYSGGTIDNNREESLWQDRNKEMAKSGIGAEKNAVDGTNENVGYRQAEANLTGTKIKNRVAQIQKMPAENFINEANSLRERAKHADSATAAQYMNQARLLELVGAASTENVGPEEYIATLAADPEVQNLITEIGKTGSQLTGTVGSIFGALNNFISNK